MRVLKATAKNILTASETVKRGGLVVYPTETVYGLGCDPLNVSAVERIFEVKSARQKPLPVLASDIEHIEKIAYLSDKARRIAVKFWPGPVTLILPKTTTLSGTVTSNLDSVGVRVPMHNVVIQLIHLSDGLLVGTSANKTGEKPPLSAQEAANQIGDKVDMILDGGPTTFGLPSTIVDLTSERPKIVRKGPISINEILSVYGH
ncbi:MAG: L-threonylcarbamoyladenylate synthase [Candidatus Bathyarchaeota archaeon]|nr:L-threonylcarbamoyladenylate synthase [Candidatus Bathyarchaeota archaeon]MDH5732486.1 L-threonylcarbamoyladenylate synthase [Candidatus Bathyarchaeota archaeon]